MRPQVQWSLTLMLAGLLAVPAFGQRLRNNVLDLFQQGIDTPLLLRTPSVQKEIKLSDEQAEKFRKITQQIQDKRGRDIAKSIQEARDKVNQAIPDILSDEQSKRLQQIKLQANGVLSFTKPEVQQKLKLTDKQKEEMQALADGMKKDIRKSVEDGKNLRERIGALRQAPARMKEATDKAVAKLNEDQKKTWNEMIGDKFEFPMAMLR